MKPSYFRDDQSPAKKSRTDVVNTATEEGLSAIAFLVSCGIIMQVYLQHSRFNTPLIVRIKYAQNQPEILLKSIFRLWIKDLEQFSTHSTNTGHRPIQKQS